MTAKDNSSARYVDTNEASISAATMPGKVTRPVIRSSRFVRCSSPPVRNAAIDSRVAEMRLPMTPKPRNAYSGIRKG
jgi:hypothetical protein